MLPLLVTLLLASIAALCAYTLVWVVGRRSRRVENRAASTEDEAPAPSRLVAVLPVLLGVALVALVLGLLARAVEGDSAVVRWDERAERWASDGAGQLGTDLVRLITHLGDTVTIIAIAFITVVALLSYGHRRLALFFASVVLGQWAISNLIKVVVERARPDLDQLTTASGFSFPSGHSTSSAATYLGLAIVLSTLRPGWNRSLLVAGAVGIAVAVATSRVLLGVHWFSDVAGGLVLGWTWSLVCAALYDVSGRSSRQDIDASPSSSPSSPTARR